MQNFSIITESSCDLSVSKIKDLDIIQLPFTVIMGEQERQSTQIPVKEFYAFLRSGGVSKTSAINTQTYVDVFEQEFKKGKDILHLGFSSGLSASYNCALMAAQELKDKYPDRKIYNVDSLGGSLGQGLLAQLCSNRRASGQSIEQVAAFAEKIAPKIAHRFTVGDLQHLKRGGRISSAVAVVGSLLNIKPILKASNEGKLTIAEKVRGKAAALKNLADDFFENADLSYPDSPVFISHADCLQDAKVLAQSLVNKSGHREIYINDIGALMGAHCGPDTLAIFYVCRER